MLVIDLPDLVGTSDTDIVRPPADGSAMPAPQIAWCRDTREDAGR
jgi:hypothetical protein